MRKSKQYPPLFKENGYCFYLSLFTFNAFFKEGVNMGAKERENEAVIWLLSKCVTTFPMIG